MHLFVGTWVNDALLQPGVQWELSDGDTLAFGGQSEQGSPEFYFLFQKVCVRPLDFDAITLPKAGSFSSDLQNRIRTNQERKVDPQLDLSRLSIKRATVILNSIGSLSKINGSCWTFRRADSTPTPASSRVGSPTPISLMPPSTPPPPPALPATSCSTSAKSRRKSAHTVLLEDDSTDEQGNVVTVSEARLRGRKRRRLYKSESEVFQPPLAKPEPRPVPPRPHINITTYNNHPHPHPHYYHHTETRMGMGQHIVANVHMRRNSAEPMYNRGNVVRAAPVYRQREPKGLSPATRGRRRSAPSPMYSPLVVGGENYNLASPSLRVARGGRERNQFSRFHVTTG